MNEETLFDYTDQLILEVNESHRDYMEDLKQCKSADHLIEELRTQLLEHDAGRPICWARLFLISVFGEMHELDPHHS